MVVKKIQIPDADKRLCASTKANLDRVRDLRLGKKYDFVLVVVGKVGTGKSTLAQLACAYIDPTFNSERIFFSAEDYRFYENKLEPMQSFMFDEAADVFFSRGTMERKQKKMVLSFAKIRQKRNFIVLCVPSLMLLERWFRGVGTESRVDCIWRVIGRGKFLIYSEKTGDLKKVKIDKATRSVKYPRVENLFNFQPIPQGSDFWKEYEHNKNNYLKQADENPKARRLALRHRRRMENTVTFRNIADILHVHISTVQRWYKEGWFGTRGTFMGLDAKIHITLKAYHAGIRRLKKYKQTGRLPLIVKRHAEARKQAQLRKRGKRGTRKRTRATRKMGKAARGEKR